MTTLITDTIQREGRTDISIRIPVACDANSSRIRIDLGDLLTALVLADQDLYQQIQTSRKQFQQGQTLTHQEVFGSE
jgi:hypothetical protein